MNAKSRQEPIFALCGLNCCLCPRYHTAGTSRCPGCGGPDFSSVHPSCAVMSCNARHDKVEYCFQCGEYPCAKYSEPAAADSFISYRNVKTDMAAAGRDLEGYLADLRKKLRCLEKLINDYDDGRSKGLYCRAANLLPLPELASCISSAESDCGRENWDIKQRANFMRSLLESKAEILGIDLSLRNKG